MARAPHGEKVVFSSPPAPVSIYVNVVGAVFRPGTYHLDENSRVVDAVGAAGGLIAGADINGLNLAARVENAQTLNIPYSAGSVTVQKQGLGVDIEETPPSLAENGLVDIDTPAQDEKGVLSEPVATIATTNASTFSCAEGVVGSGVFVWPADNHTLSGNDYGATHPGIDIAAGEGSPVYAADSGIVMAVGNDDTGYGNLIQIDHGNGYYTVYAHLSKIGVRACQGVSAGQWIGAAGNTGNSRGVHLHFEVIQDGLYVDPWLVLP